MSAFGTLFNSSLLGGINAKIASFFSGDGFSNFANFFRNMGLTDSGSLTQQGFGAIGGLLIAAPLLAFAGNIPLLGTALGLVNSLPLIGPLVTTIGFPLLMANVGAKFMENLPFFQEGSAESLQKVMEKKTWGQQPQAENRSPYYDQNNSINYNSAPSSAPNNAVDDNLLGYQQYNPENQNGLFGPDNPLHQNFNSIGDMMQPQEAYAALGQSSLPAQEYLVQGTGDFVTEELAAEVLLDAVAPGTRAALHFVMS